MFFNEIFGILFENVIIEGILRHTASFYKNSMKLKVKRENIDFPSEFNTRLMKTSFK